MAKLLMPLLSISAKNKIGDVVFFRRFGQNIARLKVKPANPKTDKQTKVRYNLGKLIEAWTGKYEGQDTECPNGYVTLKKINKSTTPWTTTDVKFCILSEQEKATWKYPWIFVGANQKRLYNNQDPIRTKP